jgi:hypothetical protein
MNTIRIKVVGKTWMGKFSDPKTKRLFGTDTIPLPYTDLMPGRIVLDRIQNSFPEATVSMNYS